MIETVFLEKKKKVAVLHLPFPTVIEYCYPRAEAFCSAYGYSGGKPGSEARSGHKSEAWDKKRGQNGWKSLEILKSLEFYM